MAGSTRNKSDGSGYQGESAKGNYSSRSRNSFDTEVERNQRMNNYSPKRDREQTVNRAGKGSRLAGPMSGTMTAWMGSIKRAVTPRIVGPRPKIVPTAVKKAVVKTARKPTTINIPGGGLSTGKKASGPMSTGQARSLAPGNYSGKSVSMGGKTYNGFTVSSRTDSKGNTTKSVGNWTSTKDAGRSLGKNGVAGPSRSTGGGGKTTGSTSTKSSSGSSRGPAGYGGKNDPAGPKR